MTYANGSPASATRRDRPASRHSGTTTEPVGESENDGATDVQPRGAPYRTSLDWDRTGFLGMGLAIGLLIGAAAALLLAPASGPYTRRRIGRQARRVQLRAADAWDDLGETLRDARGRIVDR